jgi:hypothetical protein
LGAPFQRRSIAADHLLATGDESLGGREAQAPSTESKKSLRIRGCINATMPAEDRGGQVTSGMVELVHSPVSSFAAEHRWQPSLRPVTMTGQKRKQQLRALGPEEDQTSLMEEGFTRSATSAEPPPQKLDEEQL